MLYVVGRSEADMVMIIVMMIFFQSFTLYVPCILDPAYVEIPELIIMMIMRKLLFCSRFTFLPLPE